MKTQLILIFTFLYCAILPDMYAQRSLTQRVEFDIALGANISVSENFSRNELNNFYSNSKFLISTSINIPIKDKGWGVWANLSLSHTSEYKFKDSDVPIMNSVGPNYNLDNYYIKKNYWNMTIDAGLSLTVGAYRRFVFGKWAIDPRLGIGYHEIPEHISYSFEAKEKNSNRIYHNFITDNKGTGGYGTFSLTGALDVNRYFGMNERIFLGCRLAYIQNTKHMRFFYTCTDQLTQEVIETKTTRGKLPSSIDLTFRVGFSF